MFGDDVGFDIGAMANLAGAKVGHLTSRWNDRHFKSIIFKAGNGEADSIHCDGAFFYNVSHQLGLNFIFHPPESAFSD